MNTQSNHKHNSLVPWKRDWRKLEAYYNPSKVCPDFCGIVPYSTGFRHTGMSIKLDTARKRRVR